MKAKFLETKKQKVHYLEAGEGELLILLPSMWTTSASYKEIGTMLATKFHVIIPDFYKGRSKFKQKANNLEDYIQLFDEFIKEKNISKFHLIGISGSGLIAFYITKSSQNKPQKLMLFSTSLDPSILDNLEQILVTGYSKFVANNIISLDRVKVNMRGAINSLEYYIRHPKQFIFEPRIHNGEKWEMVTALPIKTKLILAENDEFLAELALKEKHKNINNLTVEEITGGHSWYFLRPQEFVEQVNNFLLD